MKHLFLYFFLISMLACKTDTKTSEQTNPSDFTIKPDNSIPTDPKNLTIPSACEMINEAQLKSILAISGSPVDIKPADDPGNISAKSCFFKWEDVNTPNAGILIQIMTNPVYDDAADYISKFVSSKLTEGETVLGDEAPIKFKRFSAGDSNGAYSFDQSRFYWNFKNDYLFMLAFNVSTFDEAKMLDVAKKIIVEIDKNFASKVKQQ
ncbi:MAG: hypothetical protein IPO92_06205 [Saprospiraceae bacterium]|nr:hypothetical protein [Saprospiraceae bacterium]